MSSIESSSSRAPIRSRFSGMDQKSMTGASLEPTASKSQRTNFSPARKHIVYQTDKSRAGAQILTPNSTMIAIAESAADKAGEEQDRKSTRLELQSLIRISYPDFCLQKKRNDVTNNTLVSL